MNITFSWEYVIDRYCPVSRSDLPNQDGMGLLDCILMDHGGLGDSFTIPWLEECLRRIESVQSGKVESSGWDRETWGVVFEGNTAKIYSVYVEEYSQIFSLSEFSRALLEWKQFIQTTPSDCETKTIDLSLDTMR